MTEEILIKYILDEADQDEIREVEIWVKTNPANAKKLDDLKIILDTSKRLAKVSPLAENEAWDRFKERRANTSQSAKVIPMRSYTKWMKVAAAVILVTSATWSVYSLFGPQSLITIEANNVMRMITLPDSSKIYINKNSSITYARNFTSKREIKLNGEAFFDVKHDEKSPFSVIVNGINVKDIGTAFNLKGSQKITEVIVESGVVEVSKNANSARLAALDMITIKAGDPRFVVRKNTELSYNDYTNRSFVARNVPLNQLISMLNKAYQSDIRIANPSISNYPISITISKGTDLKEVLEAIKLTTPEMQIDQHGASVILR